MGMPGMPTPAPAASFNPTRVIKMRPDQKRPLLLKESERNPYAKRNPQEEVATQETANAEELRIRGIIGSLRVTGRSRGPNGLRVLLGDLVLEEGRVLPQLIEGQSENLRVLELNDDTVVLGWIDADHGKPTGKAMQVAYDLSPIVGFALNGRSPSDEPEGTARSRTMGQIHVERERKKSGAAVAGRAPGTGIPAKVFQAGQ
jgi:hypothetical protein